MVAPCCPGEWLRLDCLQVAPLTVCIFFFSNKDGANALVEAAANGHAIACLLLLYHGCDANQAADDGERKRSAGRDLAKTLICFGCVLVSCFCYSGVLPLHAAVEGNHAEVVRLLLRFGADRNLLDQHVSVAEERRSRHDKMQRKDDRS